MTEKKKINVGSKRKVVEHEEGEKKVREGMKKRKKRRGEKEGRKKEAIQSKEVIKSVR